MKTGRTLTYLSLLSCLSSPAYATIVTDAVSGVPLPKASVFNSRGTFIGTADDNGRIPGFSLSQYPLTIRMTGYQPATVLNPGTDEITLGRMTYDLPEIVVGSKKHQVLHLIAYVREYSTVATFTDTVMLFREKTVDFMIPAKRADKYKGWSNQRVLAARSYYHLTDAAGLDSVSKFFPTNFSWSDLVGILDKVPIPDRIRKEGAMSDTVRGIHGNASVWRRIGDDLYLDNNILTDINNGKMVPDLYRVFSRYADFQRFNTGYVFSQPDHDMIFADNISMMTFNIESFGKGDYLRKVFHTDDPIYITTYGELYVTGREYISVKEALKWERNPPLGDEIGILPPPEAGALPENVASLVERVDNFDYNAALLSSATDPKIHVMKHFNEIRKTSRIKRILKKIFK